MSESEWRITVRVLRNATDASLPANLQDRCHCLLIHLPTSEIQYGLLLTTFWADAIKFKIKNRDER